ncbi:MAG: ABC transporter ATP-binding protein [Verrucomicrobia bacterium]|nr:ABC transporter ATP-binding protein [Verrucomicrobiota bacterium]MBR4248711.1 ABC transporter ATP-binding protein [Verrucomicrobiota bacterium]
MSAFVEIRHLHKEFQGHTAINDLSVSLEGGQIVGLVGPDGAGKTTLIRLINGLLKPTSGSISINGADVSAERKKLKDIIGYMPQKFGLYEDLTVMENLRLHAKLHNVSESEQKIQFKRMLEFTDLTRFTERLAGTLSGGMKQKLGLACSLLGHPRLLLLDEPGVGVDPISRQELWRMVNELLRDDVLVLWSTSYLDEAELCKNVLLLNESELLFSGDPKELTQKLDGRVYFLKGVSDRRQMLAHLLDHPNVIDGVIQGSLLRLVFKEGKMPSLKMLGDLGNDDLELVPATPRFEDAFMEILDSKISGHSVLADRLSELPESNAITVRAQGLVKRYGNFTAADHIDFEIKQGEIFGLLGPNGAGKSTTFKMLCGLLKPTEGNAFIKGIDLKKNGPKARQHLGYMAQKFSQYDGLSLLQNLQFFAGIYGLKGKELKTEIETMVSIFHFEPYLNMETEKLPLGIKQCLALSCAVMHKPPVLFLDEPTSGVAPVMRREFWNHINGMVSKGTTVLVTTHFMDEAEYCDRMAMIYRGRTIAMGTPDELKRKMQDSEHPNPSMSDVFIRLVEASDMEVSA